MVDQSRKLVSQYAAGNQLRIVYSPRPMILTDAPYEQCPPLATIWVYTIVQLDLGPAVLGLLGVGAWTWWKGLVLFR